MEISARNALKGTVKTVEVGAVNTAVVVEIAPGVEITAIITKASAERYRVKCGQGSLCCR
jgi:molybdopterin-binding protein